MKKIVHIYFGAMSDTIKNQLIDQGLNFDEKKVALFQLRAEAVVQLRLGDLLSDTVHERILNKLFKQIESHINEKN